MHKQDFLRIIFIVFTKNLRIFEALKATLK